jgi:seryl-tRNA synthetase
MVLDIDLFRADKGGDPEKMRENQRKRYKDVKLVDLIVEKDNQWRQCMSEHLNLNCITFFSVSFALQCDSNLIS